MKKMTLRQLILAAEFAVLISIIAQITIPIGIIPLTGQTFAIGLTATILRKKEGTLAVFLYLLLGFIGIPVFAGGSSGIHVILGPTGGFLLGFIFNTWVTGSILEKKGSTYFWAIVSNIIGAFITLTFGTVWLKIAAGLSWYGAYSAGFLPFILPGIIKAVGAAYLGIFVYNRLKNQLSRIQNT